MNRINTNRSVDLMIKKAYEMADAIIEAGEIGK